MSAFERTLKQHLVSYRIVWRMCSQTDRTDFITCLANASVRFVVDSLYNLLSTCCRFVVLFVTLASLLRRTRARDRSISDSSFFCYTAHPSCNNLSCRIPSVFSVPQLLTENAVLPACYDSLSRTKKLTLLTYHCDVFIYWSTYTPNDIDSNITNSFINTVLLA